MIDETQIRHLAKLCRLALGDEELMLFSRQLAQIVEYVRQLETVGTADVEPLTYPGAHGCPLRADQPQEGLPNVAALANAPDQAAGFFRVPSPLPPSRTVLAHMPDSARPQ